MTQITPYLRKLKKGYFLTFQSTGEDLTYTFNNSNLGFRFSKYALLNIPTIKRPINGENSIQFDAIEGVFTDGLSTATPPPEGDRIDLSQWLQNYMLNLETLIIRSSSYDADTKLNTAERIFWKALKETGAIRYKSAQNGTESSSDAPQRFTEELDNGSASAGNLYSRVVKCIGEIDVDSSHKSNTNSFKEVYIYIPTQSGHTPVVLFKSLDDANYYHGQTIKREDGLNLDYIAGRGPDDDPTYAGLSVEALYDMDVPWGTYNYMMNEEPGVIWFSDLTVQGPYAYFTDSTVNDCTNDIITRSKKDGSKTVTYLRNRLDSVMIDWSTTNYRYFEVHPLESNFAQYDASSASNSFEFNAILIYYDVYDTKSLDVDGNPTVYETNLYGILFPEDLAITSGGASKMETFAKVKPSKVLGDYGNGYGIKLNFKFDVVADNVQDLEVEVTVDPFNTFSMQLFAGTMQRIAQANENFENIIKNNIDLIAKINDLEGVILNSNNAQALQKQIDSINDVLADVTPNSDLLDLISKNTDAINQILQGQTTVKLSFALDLRPYDGLRLELVGDVLTFRNTRQEYNTVTEVNINTSPNQEVGVYNILKLGPDTSLYYHRNGGSSKVAQDNVRIFIDDSTNQWKTGQSIKIDCQDEISFGSYGALIYTDSSNRFKLTAPYNKLIGSISPNDIRTNKPVIEITCVSSITYDFIITIK